ncbi:MAG TPA: ATP-grasp domain-containing protein [Gemmatimonadales bacterium]|nr:ATP-grasp domain-containing protein [Gemmatimonadales bacterium]
MKIAVVFDTPYPTWGSEDHLRQLQKEVAAWSREEPEMEYQVANALIECGHEVRLLGARDDLSGVMEGLEAFHPDLVFNAAESFRGDANLDYLIPAFLESGGWPYTGSTPLGLLVTRNKAMSKKVLAWHGIRVPGFVTFRPGERVARVPDLEFPLIIKPLQSDASQGIAQASVVKDLESLSERVTFVQERFQQPAIVEEYVEGRELYVSMLGNGDGLELLPVTEMVFDKVTRPEERIATRSAKWDESYRERKGIRNVFARRIAKAARERLESVCRTAYRALWLRDYARLDVRLTPAGELWFIEANANPFISWGHDMANAAQKAGMSYNEFIERIVREALSRHDET